MNRFEASLTFRNGARLANRLVVAPMTTSQSHADGRVSEAEAAWLERLAADGYGMVITCAAAISRDSIAFPNQMSLGDDAFLPGLRALAARMHAHPTLAVVQLCHGGSRAIPALTGVEAHSASRYALPQVPGFVPPKELAPAQIERIIDDFAGAAGRAAAAGFGGIELHGANGYLFTQFISTMTNLRRDAWGGSLENRARFAREVVRACRRRVPAGFVIGFRMSFEGGGLETGLDLDENIQIMRWLAEDGIDYGHVSHLDLAARSVKYPGEMALPRIRAGVDRALPLMCAGSVMSAADATRAMDLGADLVAIGRAAVGNTRVPARLARGEALARPPYAAASLADKAVSADFIRYMTTAVPVSSLNIVSPSQPS
jgi:2,4-dienoyl-CoA reductase-like NADH-dependent reductase (Old Yellow Enzyme family)